MNGWRPKVVALDIDGTLLKWVEGAGTTYEQVEQRTHDAVHPALDAGAHVVLASGRSPHGMTGIADLLDLRGQGEERVWVVASNGAVVFRYPPVEVVHEETFDAGPAVRAILDRHPSVLVAIEERGVGYRLNSPFPEGELSGDMIITDVEDLVSRPVSRVIIRDPEQSAEDFVALARELGLHGTDYVVGWTAWLDLSPVGVSKASGLAHVVEQLGLDQRRRARARRWPQRHRDAPVGAPRRGDGPGDPGGDRRGRRRDRVGLRGRRGGRAGAVLLSTPHLRVLGSICSHGSVKSAVRRLLAACLLAASVVLVGGPSGAATTAPTRLAGQLREGQRRRRRGGR